MGDCAENCHKCSTKGTAKCDVDGCITGYHHNADNDTCVGECLLYDLETGVVVRLDLCLPPPLSLSLSLSPVSRTLSRTKLLPVTHVLVDTWMLTIKPVYTLLNVSDELKWTIKTHLHSFLRHN